MIVATAFDNAVGLGIAGLVLAYLVFVLVFPERF